MARSFVPRKSSVITFVVVLFFIIAPSIFENYPQTVLVASAVRWVGDKFVQGIAALAFVLAVTQFCVLLRDIRKWLTGAAGSTTPTPEALEEGTAPRLHALEVLEAEVAGAEPPTLPSSVQMPLTGKILSLISCSLFFSYEFYQNGLVSLDASVTENLGAFFLFILRGLEILFVTFWLLVFVVWATGMSLRTDFRRIRGMGGVADAAPTAPAEVLFDEVTTVEQEPVAKEKKEKNEHEEEEKA
ncbi:hypothetical protein B0H10DRAFT_2066446 [Mycena sp. CBHHK59/15]|nr:hypothetical protein B0H10DRAFT_2066446 [Mycena sp. CBHHK59/15]